MIKPQPWAPSYQEEVLAVGLHEKECRKHGRDGDHFPPEKFCDFYMSPSWKLPIRQIWVQAARATLSGQGEEALDVIRKQFEPERIPSLEELKLGVILAIPVGSLIGVILGGALVLLCRFLDWVF